MSDASIRQVCGAVSPRGGYACTENKGHEKDLILHRFGLLTWGTCPATSPEHKLECKRVAPHGGLHRRGDIVWDDRSETVPGTPTALNADRYFQPVPEWVRSGRTSFAFDAPILGDWPKAPGVAERLAAWWRAEVENEIAKTAPKVDEYGATDLVDLGRDLARLADRGEISDEEATELGIYFYVRGKMSRWADAIMRGDRPSDDTLFDIGVYIKMAQRTRNAGGWPEAQEDK